MLYGMTSYLYRLQLTTLYVHTYVRSEFFHVPMIRTLAPPTCIFGTRRRSMQGIYESEMEGRRQAGNVSLYALTDVCQKAINSRVQTRQDLEPFYRVI